MTLEEELKYAKRTIDEMIRVVEELQTKARDEDGCVKNSYIDMAVNKMSTVLNNTGPWWYGNKKLKNYLAEHGR